MPYGKQEDFPNPTVEDFETKATPEEKKLWDEYLKDYPEHFQRSVMPDVDHFLFVCPSANLAVELEKFHHFSDTAGGVSGKKGDALRDMGLILNAYTNREIDKNFEGVCAAIDRAVKRQLNNKSLVDIPKAKRLPEDDDEVHVGSGWKVTVSGEYKEDEPVGRIQHAESVQSYGGNQHVVNPMKDDDDSGYTYNRFNKRYVDDDIPQGNWSRIEAEKKTEAEAEEAPVKSEAPAETVEGIPFTGGTVPDIPAPDLAKPEELIPAGSEMPSREEIREETLKILEEMKDGNKQIVVGSKSQTPEVKKPNAAILAANEPVRVYDVNPISAKNLYNGKHIFVARSADIIGNVSIGNDCSIWYSTVLRGDQSPICIGDRTNIQDGTIIHEDNAFETTIGSGVTVGHNCTIHGCTIDNDVLIGMGSIIMNGAHIRKNSIIGAGSLVTQNKSFPEGSLILGNPARVVRQLTDEEIEGIKENAEEYIKLMDNESGKAVYETPEGGIFVRD